LKKYFTYEHILTLLLVIITVIATLVFQQNAELKRIIKESEAEISYNDKILPLTLTEVATSKKLTLTSIDSSSVILNFFTTKCQVCKENQKYWDYIVKKHGNKYQLYAISFESAEVLKKHYELSYYKYKIYYSPNRLGNKQISKFPTTIVIRGNRISIIWLGKLDFDFIDKL